MKLIDEVPFDIISSVLSLLDAKELILLSLTCKAMHNEVHGNRALWINLIHHLLDKECICRLAFPTETMSLEGLKRLATRPLRLYRDLISGRSINLTASPLRVHPGPDFPTEGWNRTSHPHAFMIPGGRWVFGCAWDGTHYRLYCWDVLREANEGFAPKPKLYTTETTKNTYLTPVASLRVEHDHQLEGTVYTVIHEMDPQNQRTVVLIGFEVVDFSVMEIVSLDWPRSSSSDPPTISRLNYLYIPKNHDDNPLDTLMERNIVCVCRVSDDWWLLWDWYAHSAAKVHTPGFEFDQMWLQPSALYGITRNASQIFQFSFPVRQPLGNSHVLPRGFASNYTALSLVSHYDLNIPPIDAGNPTTISIDHIDCARPHHARGNTVYILMRGEKGHFLLLVRKLDPSTRPEINGQANTSVQQQARFQVLCDYRPSHELKDDFVCMIEPDLFVLVQGAFEASTDSKGWRPEQARIRVVPQRLPSANPGFQPSGLHVTIDEIASLVNLQSWPCFRSGVFFAAKETRFPDSDQQFYILRYV